MRVFWSIVWGILTFATMYITILYYIPILTRRAHVVEHEALADVKDRGSVIEKKLASGILMPRRFDIALILVATCIAIWCGYVASGHASSMFSMLKMTLAMSVLSCTFITDMKLLLIPNMCSVILVIGRVLTIVAEFIMLGQDAIAWMISSLIVVVATLLLLAILSRLSQGGLGMGDVKIYSSLGFLCGLRAVCFTLMFSFLLCAIVSTILLLSRRKKLHDYLPLGPFIWVGYCSAVLLSVL